MTPDKLPDTMQASAFVIGGLLTVILTATVLIVATTRYGEFEFSRRALSLFAGSGYFAGLVVWWTAIGRFHGLTITALSTVAFVIFTGALGEMVGRWAFLSPEDRVDQQW